MESNDITVTLESSMHDRQTKIKLNRSFLDPNDLLLQQSGPIKADGSLVIHVVLPDLAPAKEYTDVPASNIELEKREAILAEGKLVSIHLRQGTRAPVSVSATNKATSWTKGADADSVPGFELFHERGNIKNNIPETTLSLVPSDPAYSDKLYIDCPTNNRSDDKRLYCECHTTFASGLYGTFSFSKSNFEEWKTIHQKVSAWIESKIIN